MALVLSLFGVPSLSLDGAVQPLPFERRTQLFAHLALKRSWVTRDELAALLWPEQDTRLAQTNLRKALFRLQGLPGADRLDTQGRALRVDLPTDVQAFEQALREGRSADALALRRGELLAGFDDAGNDAWTEWLGFERERPAAACEALPGLGHMGPVTHEAIVSAWIERFVLRADPVARAPAVDNLATLAQPCPVA